MAKKRVVKLAYDKLIDKLRKARNSGKWFGVDAVSRTSGYRYSMKCRGKKPVLNSKRKYTDIEANVMTVWRCDRYNGYRCIALEGLLEVRFSKKRYILDDDHHTFE